MSVSLPTIAIVGRPNVGKSTLFNRLIKKRKAITTDYAGFSRDRNYDTFSWEGKEFSLIDTGGWHIDPNDQIWHLVRNQIELAIKEADLILFVVDGKEGLHPLDKELFNVIRKCDKKKIILVNKIDSTKEESNIYQFYELNEEVIGISSEHGLNINNLLDKISFLLTDFVSHPLLDTNETKIAIVGKPNVGKSSLINALMGEERVITHSTPGTTRDAIDIVFKYKESNFRLIDTAGIRKRKKTNEVFEILSVIIAQKSIQKADVCLLMLEPSSIAEQDTKIANMVQEGKCACIIIVNKSDLLKELNIDKNTIIQQIREKLYFLNYAPILFVSAKTKKNIIKILPSVNIVNTEYNKTVKKNDLQELIIKTYTEHQPPITKGPRTKIYAAKQIRVAPPTFCVWIKGAIPIASYKTYLKNQIRKTFIFNGSPIHIVFKKMK